MSLIGGRLSRRARARLILIALSALLALGLWRPLARHGAATPVERTDSALYSAVTSRLAGGDSYYEALGVELRTRGYPTGSVFNWRIPTLLVALARFPRLMRGVLIVVAAGVLWGTYRLFARAAPEVMLLALLAQIGSAAGAFTPLAIVLHESWSGLFIAASALLYASHRFTSGAILGLTALFLRELAAPYVVACAMLALVARRRKESLIWVIGGLVWVAFYAVHAVAARQSMQPEALVHPSWLQFGGYRFVLATIGFGGWLYLLPAWIAAFGGVLIAASPWAPIQALHVKVAALTYALVFLVVGQAFNQSWGLMAAPVWSIAFGLGVLGIVELIRNARS